MNKQEIEKAIKYWEEFKSEIPELKSSYPDAGLDGQEEFVELAISALTQQLNNGWIPVSNGRLPSTEECQDEYGALQPIRVTRKSRKEYRAYYNGKEWSDTFTGELFEDVIAWASIPKPYKEVSD